MTNDKKKTEMLVKSAKTGQVKSIDMTDMPIRRNVTIVNLNDKRKGAKKL